MRSNMILHVEFLPGTDIQEAISEAKAQATALDVRYIKFKFKFNGKELSIGQRCNIDDAVAKFRAAGNMVFAP